MQIRTQGLKYGTVPKKLARMKEAANAALTFELKQADPSERDNYAHSDQGVHAGNGDAEIEAGHHILRFPVDLFARHCNIPSNFSRPNSITRKLGNRSGSKAQK